MAQENGRIRVFESLAPRQQRSTLVGILVFVAIVMAVVNTIANGGTDWRGLTDNFSTELLGAALTFFIFDLFQERRDGLRLFLRLIREMRSKDGITAHNALTKIKAHGWLGNGSLRGANLSLATLAGEEFWYAKLQEVDLSASNLQMSIFAYADLQRSRFNGSDLQKASFWQANLQGCDLRHAKLQGAVLTGANLQGTDLTNAEFDHKTQLPDHNPGVNDSFYQPDTDMARFTDSNHPNFWRSDWSKSPAYRGNDDD